MNDEMQSVLDSAVQQLKEYHPDEIWMFGSYGTDAFREGKSDLDLCLVMETSNRYETLADLYSEIELPLPFDILLYAPPRWEECIQDPCTFASHIRKTGTLLYKNKELIPNEDTISAINEARKLDSSGKRFKTVQEVMGDLEIKD